MLSLTTGEPHPLAAVALLSESHDIRFWAVDMLQISMAQNYFAVVDVSFVLRFVYNWKTGQIVLVRLVPPRGTREGAN